MNHRTLRTHLVVGGLIVRITNLSSCNHWLNITVLVIVSFTKKIKQPQKQNNRAASRANTQPSKEYFSVPTRITLILWFVCVLSCEESLINNIIRVIRYECAYSSSWILIANIWSLSTNVKKFSNFFFTFSFQKYRSTLCETKSTLLLLNILNLVLFNF